MALALLVLLSIGAAWLDLGVELALGPTPAPDPTTTPDLNAEMYAKILIGAREALESAASSPEDRVALSERLARELDAVVPDLPADADPEEIAAHQAARLRAAMVKAEFLEDAQATGPLDEIIAEDELPETLAEDARLARRALIDGADTLTDDEADRLIDHHAWIGRLVLADTPGAERDTLLAQAKRAFLGIVLGLAAIVVAIPVGLVCFVIAAVLVGQGKIRRAYQPDSTTPLPIHASYVEALVLFLGAFIALQFGGALLASASLTPLVGLLVGGAMYAGQWALLAFALWPLARGVRIGDLRRNLGWHSGKGVIREIGAGVVGYLAGVPLVVIGFVITAALIAVFGFQPSHPIQEEVRGGGVVQVILLYSVAVLWAPIVEETMFRGAFFHNLRRWLGPILSAAIVAFFFAAIHPQGIATIPALMALAISFALIREWRGSLIGPMTAHALHNGVLITINVLLLG